MCIRDRSHTRVVTVDRHDAVAHRQKHADGFEATARSHRVFHYGVRVEALHGVVRGLVHELVDPDPLTLDLIHSHALGDRLVRPGGADLEGGLAVEPVVSYTHLRAHETVLDLVCRL